MKTLSVCVPARDAGRALEPTLRSILDQDTDAEIIVLDNASTDDTGVIAKSFDDKRVRVHRNVESLPLGENWNKAISLSRGRFVKVVRPGDILLPGALNRQLEVMGDNGIALCSAKFQIIDDHGAVQATDLGLTNLLGRRDARTLMRALIHRGPADFGPTSAAVFRRQDFDRVGGFRGNPGSPLDLDLFARVCVFGHFYGMPETLTAQRDSDTTPSTAALTEMLRFHHRLGAEYPQYVGRAAVFGGDWRLARAAADRVRGTAAARRRPEISR
ncbi:glycosyltransferase family 2 protein [Nocardia sp. CDC153]|uniref:glycosyltransferase family 2 protein n=1 Tax=Nocardia sp. CDC153 TaxID=3112167 RepID=UPI002DBF8034|nr:glycosyltransferase family 2 protein [Nocardia sp. CDC153]MEC3955830.1 glycosyltransferase family 2 protein [Nocardia sp. CDC153]